MRIALAQIDTIIGDFDGNLRKMRAAIEKARSQQADLVCFSELTTCGYPPRDFLEFSHFIERAEQTVQQLANDATDIAVVVGSPTVNPVPEGKDLYNSAYFLADGEIKHVQHKALLPTYDIFDEYRYFEPASSFEVVEYKGKRIALTICEDIWNIGNENPLYTTCPLDEMQAQQPDLVLNLSASPFDYEHAEERIRILRENTERYGLPIFYANQVGSQTEVIFDGGSIVMSPNGKVHDELPYFEECVRTYDLNGVLAGEQEQQQPKDKIALIHNALIEGIRDYFGKLGLKGAIFGLSGGIDSAVTAVLTARALGPENVRCLLMPSQFSSDHSVNDARELAENLNIQYDIIGVEPMYNTFMEALKPHYWGQPFGLAEENIQARVRGILLMAISNKYSPIVLNTTNKSEMAVGYGTLYGDLNGGLSVIGDVYKTDVYRLAEYINKNAEVIPQNTITKPPSAELRPDQKDTDSLPPYDLLDEVLYRYIELRMSPNEIIDAGYDTALVKRILKMVNRNEFKRYQTAPVLRVSPKAFGVGRRMPIVGSYFT